MRRQLNARKAQENFLGTPYFFTLSADEQRLCYHVLLGKEPPPGVFLIPAPKGTSTAGNAAIPAHKSAPSLKDSMQQQQQQQGAGLLRPPMPHKAKTAPGASMSGIASHAIPSPPPKDDHSVAARDSRSRYRNSSAPTTPSASRTVSPEARPARASMDHRSDRTQKHHRIYQAQTINIQNVAAKLQVVQTKGSPTRTAVPAFAHKPSNSPSVEKQKIPGTSAIAPMNSETKHEPHGSVSQIDTSGNVRPSASNAQPQAAVYTHPAHKIVAHRNSILPTAHNKPAADSMISEPSSKGLSIVGPEGLYPARPKPTTHPAKSPATVPIVQKPTKDLSSGFVFELDAVSPQVATFPSTAVPKEVVAELPTPKDLAELPGNNEVSLPSTQPILQRNTTFAETPVSPPQVQAEFAHSAPVPAYRDSPVSPPTSYKQLDLVIQPLNPVPSIQDPKMVSTPPAPAPKLSPSPPTFDALPPSLMIGFRSPQRQLTADHPSRARASSESSNSSNSSTTAKQYQRYYSPPLSRETSPNNGALSTPSSKQPSPNHGPVYKAYTPPITPPMQAKTETEVPSMQQHAPFSHPNVITPSLAPATVSSPPQNGPTPMDRAQNFVGRASPPNILRAGAPQPLKPTRAAPLPNPLAANPPTPRIPTHAKHDSHQGHQFQAYSSESSMSASTAAMHHQPRASYNPYSQHATTPTQQSQYVAFSVQHVPSTQPARKESGHQRNVSTESNTSTASHDSERLAQEYQIDLPPFEAGFGEQAEKELKKSWRPSYSGTGYGF